MYTFGFFCQIFVSKLVKMCHFPLGILAGAKESFSNFVTVPDLIQPVIKVVLTKNWESKVIMDICFYK